MSPTRAPRLSVTCSPVGAHGLIGNFLTNESFEQLLYYYVLNGGGLSTIEVPSLTVKAHNIIESVL